MNDALAAILESTPYILSGVANTLGVVLGAMIGGLALGVPMAVAQVYGPRPLKLLVNLYVWFFRGVPILVLFLLFYFGLFSLIGLDLNAFFAASAVLALVSAAYQSQIFRGAIQSLPAGQMRGALALGMTRATAIRTVILPQALRLAIPGWSNEYSIILKDSAVAFALGVPEIMARTHMVASRTYMHLPLYALAGIIFFLLTVAGTRALNWLERKTRIKGYAH